MISELLKKIHIGSYKIFFDLIKLNRKKFFILILLFLLQVIILSSTIITIIPLADIIVDNSLQDPNKVTQYFIRIISKFNLKPTIILFILIFIVVAIFKSLTDIIVTKEIYKIRYTLERDLFRDFTNKIFLSKWSFFFKYPSSYLLNIYTYVINQICSGFTAIAVQASMVIKLIAYLVVPTVINYKITLFAIILAILTFIPLNFFSRKSYSLGKQNLEANNEFLKNLTETFQSLKLIFSFNKVEDVKNKNQNIFNRVIKLGLKTSFLSIVVTNSFSPIGLSIAAITFVIFLDTANDISILAAVFWSLVSSIPIMQNILQGNLEVANLSSNYERYKNIIQNSEEMKFQDGSKNFDKINEKIYFENVSFNYPNRKKIIDNCTFNIEKNRTYLISGPSGVGKSSLIDLIMGFQKPTEGNIYIDEIKLNEFIIESYRTKIGYVPQDSFLYSGSIKDNIYWSNPSIDEIKIKEILEISNCDSFINNMPSGLNTEVGERGNMLSGGQKQRVALARALSIFPKILILDEATTSLDNESSMLIKNSLEKLKGKMTILIISHELDFFKNVDNVIKIENGKIKVS